MTRRKNTSVDFWISVSMPSADGCWIWGGMKSKLGYGRFGFNNKVELAHRMAYMLTHGPIPDGMHVCHTCDNPPCCNPSHLFLGTAKDNSRDCLSKGRRTLPPSGEEQWSARLTRDQSRSIRVAHSQGTTPKELAHQYGVAVPTIYHILRGRNWKDI